MHDFSLTDTFLGGNQYDFSCPQSVRHVIDRRERVGYSSLHWLE